MSILLVVSLLFGLDALVFVMLAASPRAAEPCVERGLLTFALAALVVSLAFAAAGGLA